MALEKALYPAMTTDGLGRPSRPYLGNRELNEFPVTKRDYWLVPYDVAADALVLARAHLCDVASDTVDQKSAVHLGARALAGAELVDDTGCWLPGEPLSKKEQVVAVQVVAEEYRGQPVLHAASQDVQNELRVCDEPKCLFPRHRQFIYGNGYRRHIQEPPRAFFDEKLENGEVVTKLGDILPSLEESIADFRKLQEQCPPFANEKESPLTAYGISRFDIDEETACWVVQDYYDKPPGTRGAGTDGYARTTFRSHLAEGQPMSAGQQLAHRVLYVVMGGKLEPDMVLNHLCRCRACAYPEHVVQVSREENQDYDRQAREVLLAS